MKQERTLVVLAAGIGSRFAGGVKQLQCVGPSGEVIMDYSIHDAIEAGFNRFVFIIRHDIEEMFDRVDDYRIADHRDRMTEEDLKKREIAFDYLWNTEEDLLYVW
jgi:choline kinase